MERVKLALGRRVAAFGDNVAFRALVRMEENVVRSQAEAATALGFAGTPITVVFGATCWLTMAPEPITA
jgi:hypothetical protein